MKIISDTGSYPVGVCTGCGGLVSTNPQAREVHENFHDLVESTAKAVSSVSYTVGNEGLAYRKSVADFELGISRYGI